jgi:hypothetical protein
MFGVDSMARRRTTAAVVAAFVAIVRLSKVL